MEIQQELIDRCIHGDRRAENELYKTLYGFLMSVCRRYFRQEEQAREALNLGFCRILMKINMYQPTAPFQFWARRILINVIMNEIRKEKTHYGNFQYEESLQSEKEYAVLNKAIETFNLQYMASLIESLPNATRQVFNLFVVDGFSHKEIADLLDISEGTSKWHMNAARNKLKELIHSNEIKIEYLHD